MQALVATKQADLRLAIELYLVEEPGMDIVGTASEAAGLRSLARTTRPDLIMLDWDLPGHSPTSLLAELKRIDSCLQVIVLGKELEQRTVVLAAGADAFVLKGDPPGRLLTAIRQARAQRATAENQIPTETKGA